MHYAYLRPDEVNLHYGVKNQGCGGVIMLRYEVIGYGVMGSSSPTREWFKSGCGGFGNRVMCLNCLNTTLLLTCGQALLFLNV